MFKGSKLYAKRKKYHKVNTGIGYVGKGGDFTWNITGQP